MTHATTTERSRAMGAAYFHACLVLAGLVLMAGLPSGQASATAPPPLKGPIATVGNRTVEAIDIQRAALILANDPLRKQSPAQWRRMLLDRCVDRELLSMEAERRGLARDPEVRAKIADREYLRLYQLVDAKVLRPRVEPTEAEIGRLREGGLYRVIDLHYILLRDVSPEGRSKAERMATALRAGARFDSIARLWSGHPSRGNGGHFGPVLVRDLDSASYAEVRGAKVGAVFGPYSGQFGHEIYMAGGFQELSEDSLRRVVRIERERNLIRDYRDELLRGNHFAVDTTMVGAFLFAMGSETPDSILASLRPDGTRPKIGVRPALGVLARVDGDSITFQDLMRETHPAAGAHGRIRVRDAASLGDLAGQAFFRRLLVRDARERKLVEDPLVARELRLIRDEAAVVAMVERARPPDPVPAKLQAWFEGHASRYRRPPARTARVAVFPTHDSAMVALRAWNGTGISDSALQALRFVEQPNATARYLYPGHTAVVTLLDDEAEPLSAAARTLDANQVSPVVRTTQGYAIAQVVGREAARPYGFDEVLDRVRRDWREEKENEWVLNQLERIRATTPVRIIPARLEAVRLGSVQAARPGDSTSQ